MAQFSWPSLAVSASNPAVGPTGAVAPASATEVGGVDPSGNLQALQVTVAKALVVDGSAVTQPISAAALPLPAGAATSAKQDTGNTSLASIDTKTPALQSGRVPVDGSGVTQPVSAAALPLPTGAATSALQTTGNTSLASLDGKVTTTANGIKVDGSAVTQPVSGTVSVGNFPATQPVSGSVSVSNFPATQTVTGAVSTKTNPAGTLSQAAITVGTTAVRLTASGSAPASTRQMLLFSLALTNTGKIYLGSSTVTSSGATAGVPFSAGAYIMLNNDAGDYFVVSDTAGQTVYVVEQT